MSPNLKSILMTEKKIHSACAADRMISICRSYNFESAHFLPKVPEDHRCRNLHGHNYRVEVIISGTLDERGFVCDFAEIDELVQPLLDQVDHKLLNDIEGLENPTAEIIALWFLERLPNVSSIKVYENESCWAEASR